MVDLEKCGTLWEIMDVRPRASISSLTKSNIPIKPGVYALYRNRERVYVGKGDSLRKRIWNNHCGKGRSMTGSALRRNIAEHLGISSPADIKARRYMPTEEDAMNVRIWLEVCEIAWIECETDREAISLEEDFKNEYMPFLTKR